MVAIEVKELTKKYGDVKAVRRVSFSVNEGEIFGMVGPNGAGKTTTIECIEGLRKPDSGSISVLGINPAKEREKLYDIIGVQLQEASYQDRIRVWELCELFSSFYKNPLPYKKLLSEFGMEEKKNSFISRLSGGEKQRVSVILALIGNPRVVFLDELTTGLDPQARRQMWELVRNLKIEGRTIYLTTHYMEEAEYLCDRVAIMDHGEIIAFDTPQNLIRSSGLEEAIIFTVHRELDLEILKNIVGVKAVSKKGDEITVLGMDKNLLNNLVSFLQKEGYEFSDLRYTRPNLEDVFLKLTGRQIRE